MSAPTPATHPALAYRLEGRRWRGKLVVPEHAHPIVRRMIREANRQRATLTEIAARAGLRRHSLLQWGRRNHPRIDHLEAALGALGLRLRVVQEAAAYDAHFYRVGCGDAVGFRRVQPVPGWLPGQEPANDDRRAA